MTLWSQNDPPEPANHDFKNEAPAKWPSGAHSLTGKKWPSLWKHPFLLALRRWGRFARRTQGTLLENLSLTVLVDTIAMEAKTKLPY